MRQWELRSTNDREKRRKRIELLVAITVGIIIGLAIPFLGAL